MFEADCVPVTPLVQYRSHPQLCVRPGYCIMRVRLRDRHGDKPLNLTPRRVKKQQRRLGNHFPSLLTLYSFLGKVRAGEGPLINTPLQLGVSADRGKNRFNGFSQLPYGWNSRKNRLPAGGTTITCFSLPTTDGTFVIAAQLGEPIAGFCCRENPSEGAGQATTTVLVAVRTTRSNGEPGVCTAAIIPQNPPSSV